MEKHQSPRERSTSTFDISLSPTGWQKGKWPFNTAQLTIWLLITLQSHCKAANSGNSAIPSWGYWKKTITNTDAPTLRLRQPDPWKAPLQTTLWRSLQLHPLNMSKLKKSSTCNHYGTGVCWGTTNCAHARRYVCFRPSIQWHILTPLMSFRKLHTTNTYHQRTNTS